MDNANEVTVIAETTSSFTAVDMATAAADGYKDGLARGRAELTANDHADVKLAQVSPELTANDHADVKLAWAKGETVQFFSAGQWADWGLTNCLHLYQSSYWRIKPRTVVINGVEVPAPECAPLEIGQRYYMPNPLTSGYFSQARWENCGVEGILLARGLVYLNAVDAATVAKAMIKNNRVG